MTKIPSSEITPEAVYLNRRQFMKVMGAAALGALLAACQSKSKLETLGIPGSGSSVGETPQPGQTLGLADELGDPLTTFEAVTTYNNFYEFSMDKEAVAKLAKDFQISPWTVTVGGLVNKPRIFGIEDLLKIEQEERIYRMRCVEGWSMVIPWLGFPIRKLLEVVEPLSSARYLRFEALLDEKALPGQRSGWFAWPYVEGLRLDEAMHDLAILSTGLYGKQLLPQNGAPVRLVVPWKYGFKSIKSIVRIDLVEEMPTSLWMEAAPNEYGFYANVNPEVPHPRWSQATERRIGELGRRDTLMFNGYADEVASLYTGMDLQKNY